MEKVKIETAVNLIGELMESVTQKENFLEGICGNCRLTLRECATNMLIHDEEESEALGSAIDVLGSMIQNGPEILRGHDVLNEKTGSIESVYDMVDKKILRNKLKDIRDTIGYLVEDVETIEKQLN